MQMADRKRATREEDEKNMSIESKNKRIRTSTSLRIPRKSVNNLADSETKNVGHSQEFPTLPGVSISRGMDSYEESELEDEFNERSLVNRVKEIKQRQRNKSEVGSQSRLQDEQISMEEFSQSLRSLDTVCNTQKSLKRQNQNETRLGLVSFQDFQNRFNPKKENPAENRQSITHLSFDEDNEEDMFEDAKDELEDADKSDQGISFLGFSNDESELSKNTAARYLQWVRIEKFGDFDWQDFRGFASTEIKKSQEVVENMYFLLDNCEPTISFEQRKNLIEKKDYDQTYLVSPRIRELKELEAPKCSNKKEYRIIPPKKMADVVEQTAKGRKINTKELCGFSTASGRKISVSETAILQAQRMYTEIEQLEPGEEVQNCDKKSSDETNMISKALSSKEKDLFDEMEDELIGNLIEPDQQNQNESDDKLIEPDCRETKEEIRNDVCFGFKTAHGKELKISKEALSKAQAQFDEIRVEIADDVLEKESIDKESTKIWKSKLLVEGARRNEIKNESKDPVIITPSKINKKKADDEIDCGFKTAKGNHMTISKEAIAKAKAQFDEVDKEVNANVTPKNCKNIVESERIPEASAQFDEADRESRGDSTPNNVRTGGPREKMNKLDGGFSTAGGREIKISEAALKRAKAQFEDVASEFMQSLSQMNSKINNPKVGVSSTSSAQSPSVEENLAIELCNIESLEFDDFVMEESEASKKRKFEEIDDDTPIRKDPSWKRKKGRATIDLQGRKLFDEEPVDVSIAGEGESEKDLISKEIDASAAALIEDEELSKEMLITESRVAPGAETPMEIDDCSQNVENSCGTTQPSSRFDSILIPAPGIPKTNLSTEEEENVVPHGESIPDDLNFASQFSQDHSHAQVINKFMMEMMKMMEARSTMTLKQNETIRAKRMSKPRACDGSLYELRTSKKDSRFTWRELTEGQAPVPREQSGSALDSEIFSITASSAASYSFCCADFYGGNNEKVEVEGIKVGDGAFLILDERNCAGAREFERAFFASPGVDPKLVPAGWVKNHYGLIVWKLASMDRVKFGHKCLPRMLTPNRVMLELKYRYDREIYRTQWPPLRRILEKSEDATGRLVLCVASVNLEDNKTPLKGPTNSSPSNLGSASYKMTLTDGWYSIPASTDIAMINCIKSGKVKEGTKLITFGATAMNLDQGCSVLEIPDCVTLKIHTNSTRRARWDTKMDFYRANRGPMPLSLRSVKSNGGVVCKLVVAVSRSYPVLYREKLADGQFVFRNARCDEEAARVHEARCQSKMEEICDSVSREFQFSMESTNQEEKIRRKIAEKLKESLPPPRDVTPVLKVRIAEDETSAMMTIWSSDRETDQVFEEGSSIVIYNCFASGQRCNELQITAGRNTVFHRETSRSIKYPERIYTSLMDVGEAGFNPVYGEFDTVGIVSSIGPAPHGMKNFETVNLACPRPANDDTSDFLSVLFWQGISAHGYSKILTVGTPIACSNLEWRRNTSRSIPTAFCTERSIFTKNPRQKHLTKPFDSLRETIKDPVAYATNSGRLIEEEIAKKTPLRVPGNGTPCRVGGPCNSTTPGSKSRDSIGGSIEVSSTPRNNSRKASIMRRIERLEAYGEPPKLPPISVNHNSPKVLSDFRSPVVTPVTKS
ncbi:breast cancer type 2 susceptibility protein homolog isoform X2 [Venturia canescens]|uniref:breast cancer type 2 susceptibility protein homolog isoform X2 n=1 Tax=Venturia canescens TaxID=32260 RepID=UPI001C9BF8C7|nr:breast cancer type 2 susceptibility protein homolog isoform X2 [Venturia canescens]